MTMTGEQAISALPETIRRLKKLSGVTDAQIGRAVGVSRSVANMRVTGVSQWSYAELVDLANYWGLPIEVLFLPTEEAVSRAFNDFGLAFRRFTCTGVAAGQKVRDRAA